ncbi:MAG TPA: rhodanese-like domain-containing protein, partial [Gammaproteobacteria bacterium]|nr:rhodanese-like domain-containing protein [Gammaproteobacteria bacterium]
AGFKTESGNKNVGAKVYRAEWKSSYLRTLADVKANLKNPTQQIIDLRHPVRYAGGKETRPELRSGHIPGSICLPYYILFEKDGTFLPQEKIRKKLNDLNIDPALPILITCGSAITAPILDFLLDIMNYDNHGVYDGAWAEYGSEKLYAGEDSLAERPIETCVDS